MKSRIKKIRFRSNYFLIPIILSNFLHAQNIDSIVTSEQPRWNIVFYFAFPFSEASKSIEDIMKANGFDLSESNSWFGGAISYPQILTNGTPWLIDIQYNMNGKVSAGVQFSNSAILKIEGLSKQGFLIINYSILTLTPAITYNYHDVIYFGIGPSVNYLSVKNSESGTEVQNQSRIKFGAAAYTNLRFKLSSVLSLNLLLEYNYMGKSKIGPYGRHDSLYESPAVFPNSDINFSQTIFCVGLGLHL